MHWGQLADTTSGMPPLSPDRGRIGYKGSATNQELADQFGVSTSTLDRVKTILDQGTPEQIQALREKGETGEGPGVRAVYEQVQSEKLKSKLQGQQRTEGAAQQQEQQQQEQEQEVRRDNLKLINKDFRTVTRDEMPDGSADLVCLRDRSETGGGPGVRVEDVSKKFEGGNALHEARKQRYLFSGYPEKQKTTRLRQRSKILLHFLRAQKPQDNREVVIDGRA